MTPPLTPAATAHTASVGGLFIRLCGTLALVILLILTLAWLARRAGWGSAPAQGDALLRVRQSLPLGQRERVVLLEVRDRWLLLGVTPESVTLLSEFDAPPERDAAAPRRFQQRLANAISKKEHAR